jgi:hypothetical protein
MVKILIKPIDEKMENLTQGQSKVLFNDVGSVRIAVQHLVNEYFLGRRLLGMTRNL